MANFLPFSEIGATIILIDPSVLDVDSFLYSEQYNCIKNLADEHSAYSLETNPKTNEVLTMSKRPGVPQPTTRPPPHLSA